MGVVEEMLSNVVRYVRSERQRCCVAVFTSVRVSLVAFVLVGEELVGLAREWILNLLPPDDDDGGSCVGVIGVPWLTLDFVDERVKFDGFLRNVRGEARRVGVGVVFISSSLFEDGCFLN